MRSAAGAAEPRSERLAALPTDPQCLRSSLTPAVRCSSAGPGAKLRNGRRCWMDAGTVDGGSVGGYHALRPQAGWKISAAVVMQQASAETAERKSDVRTTQARSGHSAAAFHRGTGRGRLCMLGVVQGPLLPQWRSQEACRRALHTWPPCSQFHSVQACMHAGVEHPCCFALYDQ